MLSGVGYAKRNDRVCKCGNLSPILRNLAPIDVQTRAGTFPSKVSAPKVMRAFSIVEAGKDDLKAGVNKKPG